MSFIISKIIVTPSCVRNFVASRLKVHITHFYPSYAFQKMLSRHVNQHFSENEDKQVNGSGSIGGGVGSIAGISAGSGSGSGIAGSSKSHVAKKSTNKSWQDSAASGSHCPYRGPLGVEKKPKSGSGMSGTGNGGENGKTSSDTLYLARKTACHTKEVRHIKAKAAWSKKCY